MLILCFGLKIYSIHSNISFGEEVPWKISYVEISSNPLSRDGRSYLLNKWRPALCYTYYMDLNALNYLVRDTLNVAQNKHGFRDFSVHESVEAIFSRSARSRQFPSLLLPRFSLNLWFQTVASQSGFKLSQRCSASFSEPFRGARIARHSRRP